MRKYFITGLVLLLPLALTFIIVAFLFNLLTEPFVGAVTSFFSYYGFFTKGFWIFSANQLQIGISRILILALIFFFIVFLGLITRVVFIHYLIRMWDYVLHKIPFVRAIYKTCQDVIHTIFQSDTHSFKQVVMVRFPNQATYCLGLVTRDTFPHLPPALNGNKIAVFVPTTPNPTSGFLMLYDAEELIYLDMTIEDAFKYIISCGVIASPFKAVTKQEADQLEAEREE